MKHLIIFTLSILSFTLCSAQAKKYTPNPKAKQLNDQALVKYSHSNGNEDSMKAVFKMLSDAVKLDSNYYEGWSNLLSFQCHFDHYDQGLKTLKKMRRIFRNDHEIDMSYAVLLYKTGNKKEAAEIFNKILHKYNTALEKNNTSTNNRGLLFNKGVLLVLVDKAPEGKALLTSLYNSEKDPMVKSNIAFYVNNSKEQIIDDRIPGK